MPPPRSLALVAVAALAACSGPRVAVEEVLAPEATRSAGASPVASLDAEAQRARARAEQPGATSADRTAAARALFLAADARVLRAAHATLDELEAPTIERILDSDDDAPDEVRAAVEALTRAGRAHAARALDDAPEDPEALFYRAANTCLLAWSVGTRRALFDGLGAQCDDATRVALHADEDFADAAPLRLRGRFLSRAPWPVGDRDEGLRLLQRAAERAPICLNLLFLGDALHASGDEVGAREAWRRASTAPADEASRALSEWRREAARRRLDASGPAGS